MFHKRKMAAMLWPKYSWAVASANANAQLKAWFADNPCQPYFAQKADMHAHLASQAAGPVDYFEFGVAYGRSMKWWTDNNTDPASRFYGFDTFEGLPEKWEMGSKSIPAGAMAFDVPQVDDTRVEFIKGLFQATLREHLDTFERRNRIVIHCDADLYTSTLFALSVMARHLRPGDIIIFDEFSQPLHEFRAFIDWSTSFYVKTKGIASAGDYNAQVAVEVI